MKNSFQHFVCRFLLSSAFLFFLMTAWGCDTAKTPETQLNPDDPITIVLWNYYNGQTKIAFDKLVTDFNDTVGMEKGIIVDTVSHGSIQELADAVYDSAMEKLGADSLPHIFAGYPDNVFRISELGVVADLDKYFTEKELASYRQAFLLDCYFGKSNGLKVIPVVRSTETLYLNKTDWDLFSKATGTEIAMLSTWEGVEKVAERYYQWTDAQTDIKGDGKAFLGIDSLANYMLAAAMQMGHELYDIEGPKASVRFDKDFAKEMWNHLYRPYLNGYYANYGKFRSDDEKTGDILAYIGSTAGAQYFPLEIAVGHAKTYQIDSVVLPYPVFEDCTPYAIVQGAGFAVTKSDAVHEYVCVLFLKWLTAPEQNVSFALDSGYLPVKNDALQLDLNEVAHQYNNDSEIPTVDYALQTAQEMVKKYNLYANQPFQGSYDLRLLFNNSLLEQVNHDLMQINQEVQDGTPRAEILASYFSDEHFELWYNKLLKEAEKLIAE